MEKRPRKPVAGPAVEHGRAAATTTAPELSEKQLRHLRGLAHVLKPVIRLGGAGLTDAAQTDDRLQDVGKAAQVAELLLG